MSMRVSPSEMAVVLRQRPAPKPIEGGSGAGHDELGGSVEKVPVYLKPWNQPPYAAATMGGIVTGAVFAGVFGLWLKSSPAIAVTAGCLGGAVGALLNGQLAREVRALHG